MHTIQLLFQLFAIESKDNYESVLISKVKLRANKTLKPFQKINPTVSVCPLYAET